MHDMTTSIAVTAMSSSASEEIQHLKRLRAYDQRAYAELECQLASSRIPELSDRRQDATRRRIERISSKLRAGVARLAFREDLNEGASSSTITDASVDDSLLSRTFGNDVLDDLEALSSYAEEVCEAFDFYRIDSRTRFESQIAEMHRLREEVHTGQSTIARLEAELERMAADCEQADDTEIALRKENARLRSRLVALQSRQKVVSNEKKKEDVKASTLLQLPTSSTIARKESLSEYGDRLRQRKSSSPRKKSDVHAQPLSDRTNRPRVQTEASNGVLKLKEISLGDLNTQSVKIPDSSNGLHSTS